MKQFGFGKIAFSNDNGEIDIYKINEFSTNHKSGMQKKLNIKI
jgi:hypothetical protein